MSFFPVTLEHLGQTVRAFEERTLPKSTWTHEAHLKVALWYAGRYTPAVALQRIKHHIIRYNESVGTKNTAHSGYHETLTRFWLQIAFQFYYRYPDHSLPEICFLFTRAPEGSKRYPLHFYTKQLLFSREARLSWVAPDIRPVSSFMFSPNRKSKNQPGGLSD